MASKMKYTKGKRLDIRFNKDNKIREDVSYYSFIALFGYHKEFLVGNMRRRWPFRVQRKCKKGP